MNSGQAYLEVCAAVIVREVGDRRRVLLARRTRPAELAGLWEFPGGKLELGETPADCLVREIEEELAFPIEVGEWLGEAVTDRPGRDPLRLSAYAARPSALAPQAVTESAVQFADPALVDGTHDKLDWVTADELGARPLAPLDVPLIEGARRLLLDPDAHFR